MVQHAVFQLQLVFAAILTEIDIEDRLRVTGPHPVDVHAQVVEEHFRGHRPHGIRAGGVRRRQLLHAITQFLRAGQVEVTPGARFRLVT